MRTTAMTTLLNIDGIHDIDAIKNIGDYFQIHPLTYEELPGAPPPHGFQAACESELRPLLENI